jgi:hypothetical protein
MDAAFYQRILEASVPGLRVETCRLHLSGWDSVALEVNDELIFILYDAVRGALAGIIDWGDAWIGDPALDFVGLLSEYGREFTEATLAGYRGEQDATFWQRMYFYLSVVPFHEVLYGVMEGDEARIRQGVKGIEQALAQQ